MKSFAAMVASVCLIAAFASHASPTESPSGENPMLTPNDIRMVAPALEKYTQGTLRRRGIGNVLVSPRVTAASSRFAVLITRNQTIEMPHYLNLALDSGVKPCEISEVITHLAFYSGWANAMSAVAVAQGRVFAARDQGGVSFLPRRRNLFRWTRRPRRNAHRAIEGDVRRRSARGLAVHDGRAVPRPMAPPGSGAAGSQSRHRQLR